MIPFIWKVHMGRKIINVCLVLVGGGDEKWLLMCTGIFLGDKIVPKLDCGDDYTTLRIY